MGARAKTQSRPEPRTVVRTVTETWRVVSGPITCLGCGHEHYGRVNGAYERQAPQWHICEDPTCSCTALRTGS